MVVLQANTLKVKDVHQRLGYTRAYSDRFDTILKLNDLEAQELTELLQIRSDFDRYLIEGSVLENQVRLLAVTPLLRLSGFMRSPITIHLEIGIEAINLPDSQITGRMDLLALRKAEGNVDFWVLVVETKESGADAMQGLAQLLTYAYTSLEHQESVWGLTTNGINYRFVQIQAGQPPRYFLMPELNLLDTQSAIQLLQVLKAIAQL
jgi:hypothetical protein